MAKLEINEFPLNQVSLIEASAGTGKTYTLSKLYMRLILGHRLEAPASIKEILVVTFTNAATEELRGRIRTQLRASLDALMRIQNTKPECRAKQFAKDEMWIWLEQMSLSQSELERLKARLILNLNLMDEASIYTIHSFCQRLLVRFALDTRLDFSASLSFNLHQPMLVAIKDVWRRLIYPLNGWQHAMLSQELGSPEKLKNSLQDLFNRCDVRFYPNHKKNDLTAYLQDLEHAFKRAQTSFLSLGNTGLAALIETYIKEYELKKTSFKSNLITSWINACELYFNQDNPCSALGEKPLEHLISNKIVDKSHLSFEQVHEFFKQMQALSDLAGALPEYLYPFVYKQVQQAFEQQLKQANLISSNDLLKALYDSLWAEKDAGKQDLAQGIRKLYPYALIDEFQDTDAIQYGIFNLVYSQNVPSNQTQRGALMMIGDPKQAIYRFRGADIHTYIQAKKALPDARCFSLDSNWRSHPSIIAALNHLWQNPNVFLADNAIEYVPVKAGLADDKNVLQLDGKALSGVHIWHQNKKDDGLLEAARDCAINIKALLSKPASLDENPIESGDIAILVRSKAQAAMIHQALKQEQINSVLASSEFLFASKQATGLLSWLKAVNQPSNERLIRQAMMDELQLESAHSLESYLNDEQKFENQLNAYAHWQQIWTHSGVMAAMMDWLKQGERAVKLSLKDNGERCLTNLLHLGELLEQQARKLSGQKRLINWLQERIEDGDEKNDEYSLRLETDANLVQISTIHASKGLQYPIVFLPFLWADKTNIRGIKEYQHECQGHVFDFSDNKQAQKAYQKEIEAENMRLLYVAMTRAESACFIQLVNEPNTKKEPFPKAANSALGSLLKLKDINSEGLEEHFVEAQKIAPNGLYYAPTPNQASLKITDAEQVEPLTPPKALRRLDLSYKLASYSYLIKSQGEALYEDISVEHDWQSHEYLPTYHSYLTQNTTEAMQGNYIDVMANQFVRGANAGTCLHSIFELWDFKDQQALETICAQQLIRYGIDLPKEQQPALHHWLTQVVQCPIYANDAVFSLAHIEQSLRLDELEFYLPIKQLSATQINALVDSKLGFHTFKGHLKGFIDLIFCYQGRYYVADYKSNHLGEYQESYTPDELKHAMTCHHYDLQAQLYLLALDRLLAQRLPDYEAQTHLGGVLYLFIRGMSKHSQTKPEAQSDGVHYQSVDISKLLQLRALFAHSHEEAKTA